jgi:peptide/nickel transport system substrate-binding protein
LTPPFNALGEIESRPDLKLKQITELRTIFLGLDQNSPELRSSDVKRTNPFKDRRVRQAMYQAIDIEAIQEEVMQGRSVPAGMLIQPGVNGYDQTLDQRLPHDLEAAKALLVDAGYPKGFSVTLDCPNDRYINDEAICRAVASDLGEVGIQVTVKAARKAEHFPKIFNRETDFYMVGWAVIPLDSQYFFQTFFHSRGSPWSAAGYANPRVDELIDTIGSTLLTYGRDALIEEVWKIVLDDIVYLPLHHQVIVWATRDDLDVPVDPFYAPNFREARFK